MKRALLLSALVACAAPDESIVEQAALTAQQRHDRLALIRDSVREVGVFNAALIGGIAISETNLAHCYSEAGFACPGPASPSCDGGPVIALSHNPDTIYALARYRPQWVLAGHTHAGQINVPVAGGLVLPMRHKQFVYGEFRVDETRMYVTSGVGFKIKARFRGPPEVPAFTLRGERQG